MGRQRERRLSAGAAVFLWNPKFGENVGGVIRAAAAFNVPDVYWTGSRILGSKRVERYARQPLNQEESTVVSSPVAEDALLELRERGCTLIAVELDENALPLQEFVHPELAVYVFGPEDGTLPRRVRECCDSIIAIPSLNCLNLAAAANVVLAHRILQNPARLLIQQA
jgi:tRNA(Leu) C34 or U34 (ribose-2'-O)-methylase TrmL